MQGSLPCRKVRANPRHFIKVESLALAYQYEMPTVSTAEFSVAWGKTEERRILPHYSLASKSVIITFI